MRVRRVQLETLDIVRLEAIESDPNVGIYKGEVVAYHCQHCENADETLVQLLHDEDCRYRGEHGLTRYPGGLETGRDTVTKELDPQHPITIVRHGEHNRHEGVHQGEPIGFRCDECGNSDETLSEIVHDESCSLEGRHGNARINGLRAAERPA